MSQIADIDYYVDYKQESFPVGSSARIQAEQALDVSTAFMLTHDSPRDFFSGSAIEIFSGEGYDSLYDIAHTEYKTHQAPISGTPILEYRNGSTWTAVTDNWEWDVINGIISFYNGSYFIAGKDNYRARYNYDSCIDGDLRWTCCDIADVVLQVAQRKGKTSERIGEVTTTFGSHISKIALDTLDRYKR